MPEKDWTPDDLTYTTHLLLYLTLQSLDCDTLNKVEKKIQDVVPTLTDNCITLTNVPANPEHVAEILASVLKSLSDPLEPPHGIRPGIEHFDEVAKRFSGRK